MKAKGLHDVEVNMEGSKEIMDVLAQIQGKLTEIDSLAAQLRFMGVEVSFKELRKGF